MKAAVSRAALALSLVITLAASAAAQSVTAKLWREIGAGSATDNGISNETLGNAGPPAVAVDGSNGQIFVAWEGGNSDIFVKKWTGTEWAPVGGVLPGGISANSGKSRFPAIALTGDHVPVVAWLDNSSGNWEVYLKKFNPSANAWVAVGESASGGGISKALGAIASPDGVQPSIAVGSTGFFFVGWGKNGDLPTARHVLVSTFSTTTTGWHSLGDSVDIPAGEYGSDLTASVPPQYLGASQPALIVGSDNAPAVAYVTKSSVSTGDVHVRRWNGTSWQPFGTGAGANAGISGVGPHDPTGYTISSLRFTIAPDAKPHAGWIYADASGAKLIHVRRLVEGVWSSTGPAISKSEILPSAGLGLTVGSDNAPLVAWTAELPTLAASPIASTEIYLNKLIRSSAGDTWQEYGTGSASDGGLSSNPGQSAFPSLFAPRTSTFSNPVIVWVDGADTSDPFFAQIYARRAEVATAQVAFAQVNYSVNETAGNALISVTRRGSLIGESRVHYATGDGTAHAGTDYTAAEGDLVFGPGETVKTLQVLVSADAEIEPTETVRLVLSNASAGTEIIEPAASTLNILDVPAGGGHFQLNAFAYTVGEGAGKVLILVNREGGTTGDVTLHYQAGGDVAAAITGIATPGADFTTASGTLSFAAGETVKTFEVPILEDTLVEGNESFSVSISSPTGGATIGSPSHANVTITDNDTAPPSAGVIQFAATGFAAGEGSGRALVTVVRKEGSAGDVSVHYETAAPDVAAGAAAAGSDYTTVSGTLTFAEGVTTRSFEVPILEDTTVEGNEVFAVALSAPTGGATLGAAARANVTIADNDKPAESVVQFDPSEYHVLETSAAVEIKVVRSGDTTGAASVDYATASPTTAGPATATPGVDYESASGTLNFAAGETVKTFTVTILPDSVTEGSESFTLLLRNPSGAALGLRSIGHVTIDEGTPAPGVLGFANAEFTTAEGRGNAVITVFRREGSAGEVTVKYATASLSGVEHPATADVDYTATSGTLTFAAGQTSQTFTVPITDDTLVEGPEALGLVLSDPTGGATLGTPATARLVIGDNDQPAGQLQFSAATYRVREDAGQALITVLRREGSAGDVTVNYSTADGTATAGTDYTTTSGTLTFASGQTSKSFLVPIASGTVTEGPETVALTLTSPAGGAVLGAPATATLTIDDSISAGAVQFYVTEFRATEHSGAATIRVVRSEGTTGEVTVDYATTGGTATAGDDYTATSGTLTFAAGERTKTFTIPILPDTLVEGRETVELMLTNPTGGAKLGLRNMAKLVIVDDDIVSGALQFSGSAYRVSEATEYATITVYRKNGSIGAVTVKYATSDGTATAGADYAAASGTLEFAEGQTAKTFRVPISKDASPEGTETINLTLSEPTGGAILGQIPTATLTIVDPSATAGSLQFAEPKFRVNEAAGTASITVTRVGGSAGAVSVHFMASEGTAVASEDFTPVSGTLSFAPGETRKTFTVPIITDSAAEADETVHLVLSDPTGGAYLGTPATVDLFIVDGTATAVTR